MSGLKCLPRRWLNLGLLLAAMVEMSAGFQAWSSSFRFQHTPPSRALPSSKSLGKRPLASGRCCMNNYGDRKAGREGGKDYTRGGTQGKHRNNPKAAFRRCSKATTKTTAFESPFANLRWELDTTWNRLFSLPFRLAHRASLLLICGLRLVRGLW